MYFGVVPPPLVSCCDVYDHVVSVCRYLTGSKRLIARYGKNCSGYSSL